MQLLPWTSELSLTKVQVMLRKMLIKMQRMVVDAVVPATAERSAVSALHK